MRWSSLLMTAALLLGAAGPCLPARILAVLPFPGKSHFIFHWSVLKALTEEGHQVVEYSPYTPSKPMKNYTHMKVHTRFEKFFDEWTYDEFMTIASDTISLFGFTKVHDITFTVSEETFKDQNVQKLLKSNEHFDLILIESTFGQESMVVFGHKFGAPVISLHTNGVEPYQKMDAGNSLSLAYVPNYMSVVATDHMTFGQRMTNALLITARLAFYYLLQLPQHDRLMRRYYSDSVPPITDMIGNISVYFANCHPAVEYTQTYTPNIIPVAGINISPDRIPLPQDLQKFMDEGVDGVIYFSLGSMVPVHSLPTETLQIFINVFRTLKQKVLWKINFDSLPGLSKNVKLSKWLPQPGILAHPNCVLFMTHGGLFSQYEAMYAGVPTIGIPFFADQPFNIRFSEHRGYGVKLDYKTLSEETLTVALHTILKNTSYRESAQEMSRIFRDQPVSPADSVVYWTEYVLRHGGAHHLTPVSAQLSWYQLCLLDVLAAVILSTVAVIALLYVIARRIYHTLSTKMKEKSVPGKKKKN